MKYIRANVIPGMIWYGGNGNGWLGKDDAKPDAKYSEWFPDTDYEPDENGEPKARKHEATLVEGVFVLFDFRNGCEIFQAVFDELEKAKQFVDKQGYGWLPVDNWSASPLPWIYGTQKHSEEHRERYWRILATPLNQERGDGR